jgi:hypothetical protein
VRPAAEAVTVAVPDVVAVKLAVAVPSLGVTGEAGENEPAIPVTQKVIGSFAWVTVLPLAS